MKSFLFIFRCVLSWKIANILFQNKKKKILQTCQELAIKFFKFFATKYNVREECDLKCILQQTDTQRTVHPCPIRVLTNWALWCTAHHYPYIEHLNYIRSDMENNAYFQLYIHVAMRSFYHHHHHHTCSQQLMYIEERRTHSASSHAIGLKF